MSVLVPRAIALAVLAGLVSVACAAPPPVPSPSTSSASAVPALPSPTASPTPSPVRREERPLGAGFRYSTYGPAYDPGPDYWARVGREMAHRFPGSRPQAIWIVSNFSGVGTLLTFPGRYEGGLINFSTEDLNESALATFDEVGLDVWLQVEPGDAPVDELIDLILDRYGHHPCVLGVGVDVEWFHSDGTPEGQPVSDEEAAAWVTAVRAHDSRYRVFLKHWELEKMPPTHRDGLVFVDDSQQFTSLDQMVDEFAIWGSAYGSHPVAFQYGYPADEPWWGDLDDPPGDIGHAILERVPNTEALYWVDFTAIQQFPP
jgi:hypothetical protein